MKTQVIDNKVIAKIGNTDSNRNLLANSSASKAYNKNSVISEGNKAGDSLSDDKKNTIEVPKQDMTSTIKFEKEGSIKGEEKFPVDPAKIALNLESTLKLVEELHRKKLQRDRLIDTIDTLESFEVELKDDADETDGNYFQGCKLTITDDKRNEFSTKNPFIINSVATYVKTMCMDRLQEIEADITLP